MTKTETFSDSPTFSFHRQNTPAFGTIKNIFAVFKGVQGYLFDPNNYLD